MDDKRTTSGSQIIDELKLQAWLARAEIKNPSVSDEVSALAQWRDELRLQAHLGKLEAKEELQRLEPSWLKVKKTLSEAADAAGDDLKDLLADIRKGYENLGKG